MKTFQLYRRPFVRHSAAAAALVLLAACASAPKPPTQALQAAETAIDRAEQDRVAEYAAYELGEAHTKLAAAREAVNGEKMVLAERLANESRVNAEFASAKTEAAKAKAVNTEMQKGTRTLQQEMQRNTGEQQ